MVFVNHPDDRVFLLKPQLDLKTMADDEENVQTSSLIDKYIKRPPNLQNLCLAEFACWYSIDTAWKKTSKRTSKDDYLLEDDDPDNDDDHPPNAATSPPDEDVHHQGNNLTPTYNRRKVKCNISK